MPADWRALRAALPPDPYVLAAQLANAQQEIRELRARLANQDRLIDCATAIDRWRNATLAADVAALNTNQEG